MVNVSDQVQTAVAADRGAAWTQPKGATSGDKGFDLSNLTSQFMSKLGSGIFGGQAGGAGAVAGMMGATPYGAAINAFGDAAKAALNPDNLTGSAATGAQDFGGTSFGAHIVNYGGQQNATSEQRQENTKSSGGSGGPGINYLFWAGAGLMALVALKIVMGR